MKVNLWMALAVATWGCAGSMKAYAWPVAEKQAVEVVSQSIAEGQMAPDFTLKDLQGNDLALSSLRGKYVVLDFWGSWCGWCIKGIPDMKKYYDKYKDRMEIYGVPGYPTKIVVDPQGKIAKIVVGEDPAFYTYLDELFK